MSRFADAKVPAGAKPLTGFRRTRAQKRKAGMTLTPPRQIRSDRAHVSATPPIRPVVILNGSDVVQAQPRTSAAVPEKRAAGNLVMW